MEVMNATSEDLGNGEFRHVYGPTWILFPVIYLAPGATVSMLALDGQPITSDAQSR